MEKSTKISVLGIILLFINLLCYVSMAAKEKKTFIIHMAKSQMPAVFQDHTHWYDASLKSVSDSAEILYSYNTVVHGFSTRITEEEAWTMKTRPGVLLVMPDTRYNLHTTRTPSFLGLDENAIMFPESNSASEVVVGVLDTGVWPESPSFNDTGLGPIPDSWKGECEVGINFTKSNCNKKLIGARYFANGHEATFGPMDESMEYRSPRDADGHGTHTSTTAAGSVVSGASLFGYAEGTARGMAPHARVAVYKVCWSEGCLSSDILAAMDKAIEDNVNVISLSLGGGQPDYYLDSVAIGAFAAMEKGIFVSCSAGNDGALEESVTNVAPWITTVGAGTLDRDFPAYVSIGNGKNFSGVSLYKGDDMLPGKLLLPFVYAEAIRRNGSEGRECWAGSLYPEKVKGKIVLCDRGNTPRVLKGSVIKDLGGMGMVLANIVDGEELVAEAHLLPASAVDRKSAVSMKEYLSSDPNPTATILFEGTKVGIEPSPMVALFSSRGPNIVTPEILKPDLIAPGVNILAGWSGVAGPSGLPEDNRRVGFNIVSGTSMSCPHVSGIAALLKSVHPEWSPAAIRSALMTTAYTTYKDGKPMLDIATHKPSTPFDHGAGHVNPVSALDPGLVYDLNAMDYLNFLCALKYSPHQISTIARRNFTCDTSKTYNENDLNYPSFSVIFRAQMSGKGTGSNVVQHTRTLTNVGPPGMYKVSITPSSDSVKTSVVPESLTFGQTNERKSYTVTFTEVKSMPSDTNEFGRIEWSDGKHAVGSPIAIRWV